jgi:hypothetical protein
LLDGEFCNSHTRILDGFVECPNGPKNAGFWGRFLTPFFGWVNVVLRMKMGIGEKAYEIEVAYGIFSVKKSYEVTNYR